MDCFAIRLPLLTHMHMDGLRERRPCGKYANSHTPRDQEEHHTSLYSLSDLFLYVIFTNNKSKACLLKKNAHLRASYPVAASMYETQAKRLPRDTEYLLGP